MAAICIRQLLRRNEDPNSGVEKEYIMSSKSTPATRALSPISSFFSDFAESFTRAKAAREIMNRSEGYFERRGTTQEEAVRRVLGV